MNLPIIFSRLFIDIDFRKSGRWSLCNDFIFTSYHVEGQYNDYPVKINIPYIPLNWVMHTSDAEFCSVQISIEQPRIYVKAGISTVALQKSTIKGRIEVFKTERTEKAEPLMIQKLLKPDMLSDWEQASKSSPLRSGLSRPTACQII
jgi:hypothetical protein